MCEGSVGKEFSKRVQCAHMCSKISRPLESWMNGSGGQGGEIRG